MSATYLVLAIFVWFFHCDCTLPVAVFNQIPW